MKYAFPSGFQGSQLSGYLPNNKLSVSRVYHRKLLLAKNLYGDHRPPPGVCPALLAASERVPELRVPQPPPLFTRVSLSLVHKPGSPGAKVPLEQISRRATVWEENHINQKAWLCVTGQESPCWDICKLRKNLSPTLFVARAPTSHTWNAHGWQKSPWDPAGLILTVFAKRGNGTLRGMKYVSRTWSRFQN